MKRFQITLVALTLLAPAFVAADEFIQIKRTQNTDSDVFQVAAGESLELLYAQVTGPAISLRISIDGEAFDRSGASVINALDLVLNGPATIQLTGNSGDDKGFLSMRLHKPDTNLANGLLQPSSSVVIPSDQEGNVRVFIEASDDLVNWAEVLPGTYTADTGRFFRLRIETVAD